MAEESGDVLFCPYCREAFEGLADCPEHDLALVPFASLSSSVASPDARVGLFDPRHGRGFVFAAALLVLLGFMAPFVEWEAHRASAFEAALDVATNLWFVPGVAFVQIWILGVRRTRADARSARLALAFIPVVGVASVAYSWWHMQRSATAQGYEITLLWGGWLMLLALFLAIVAGLRISR